MMIWVKFLINHEAREINSGPSVSSHVQPGLFFSTVACHGEDEVVPLEKKRRHHKK